MMIKTNKIKLSNYQKVKINNSNISKKAMITIIKIITEQVMEVIMISNIRIIIITVSNIINNLLINNKFMEINNNNSSNNQIMQLTQNLSLNLQQIQLEVHKSRETKISSIIIMITPINIIRITSEVINQAQQSMLLIISNTMAITNNQTVHTINKYREKFSNNKKEKQIKEQISSNPGSEN